MSFGEVARVYDRFTDLSVYENWVDYIDSQLDYKPKRALDLGCGTGWLTQLMSDFMDEVTGLDIDPEMIAVAKDETQGIDNIHFIIGDMTDLQLPEQYYDLVTVFLDSFCFLESSESVQRAFAEIYRVLEPGAVLLFDVITEQMLRHQYDQFTYFDEDDHGALMWNSEVDLDALVVTHHLVAFDQLPSGDYQRLSAELTERTYVLSEYKAWLDEAGFTNVRVTDITGEDMNQVLETTERWFFYAEKPM